MPKPFLEELNNPYIHKNAWPFIRSLVVAMTSFSVSLLVFLQFLITDYLLSDNINLWWRYGLLEFLSFASIVSALWVIRTKNNFDLRTDGSVLGGKTGTVLILLFFYCLMVSNALSLWHAHQQLATEFPHIFAAAFQLFISTISFAEPFQLADVDLSKYKDGDVGNILLAHRWALLITLAYGVHRLMVAIHKKVINL